MRVTQVSIRPSQRSEDLGRPALTPELLAACGARYSRNNEGLEVILSKIDPENLDKSVDSIFRMLDYGHQSIADMVPVAMFMDDISIWLAYLIWTLVPTGSGQESSTRYIKLDESGLIDDGFVSGDPADVKRWRGYMSQCFNSYEKALELWTSIAEAHPEVTRIPESLLSDPSPKVKRQVERMRRNFAFDRARYFLPAAAKTNMMLLMSARGWVQLIQHLLSHPLPEANRLGELAREELALAAPSMLKYARREESIVNGLAYEHERIYTACAQLLQQIESGEYVFGEAEPTPHLTVHTPDGVTEEDLVNALKHHENRYAWTGWDLSRTVVRFSWDAVAFAEIRDLNRHRTGTKYCPPVPRGFYCAMDQAELLPPPSLDNISAALSPHEQSSLTLCQTALVHASAGQPHYLYYLPIGAQFYFEHATTADKFVYEAELRTGTGSHYRYASHLTSSLSLWHSKAPASSTYITSGTAEPE